MNTQETQEALNKSLDEMIDSLFAEETSLEKSEKPETIKIAEEAPRKDKSSDANEKPVMTADENGAKKEGEEDEEAGKKRGRPEDLSSWAKRSPDGESHGSYDASISQPAMKVPHETTIAKATVEVSKEDFEILQKAKAQQAEEILRKAKEEQSTLIKSAVNEATSALKKENEELKKSFKETQELIKSMAKKPQPRKSVASVQVLEKSFTGPDEGGQKAFTKSEMLDVAEKLVKSKQLSVDHVIELEDTGFIFDPGARAVLERALKGN